MMHLTVTDNPPHQVEMQPVFTPWGRDILWQGGTEPPVAALQELLTFTSGSLDVLACRAMFEIMPENAAITRTAMTQGNTP